jgi:Fe-S-cluster containining protein
MGSREKRLKRAKKKRKEARITRSNRPKPESDRTSLNLYSDFRFECQRCGTCCSGTSGTVTITDFERAVSHLGLDKSEFYARYAFFRSGTMRFRKENGYCVFFGRDNEGLGYCEINQVKPYNCMSTPIVASGKTQIKVASEAGISPGSDARRNMLSAAGKGDVALINGCGGIGKGPLIQVADWLDMGELVRDYREQLEILERLGHDMGHDNYIEYADLNRRGDIGPGDSLFDFAVSRLEKIYGI